MNTRNNRRKKIRHTIRGNGDKPRIVVFRSNRYLYCQAINDESGETITSVNRQKNAKEVGSQIAKQLLEKKISKVVFDRAGYRYHGKVKMLAISARENGLNF